MDVHCDYHLAEESVLNAWVGAVPCFSDKQYKCIFMIMHHMVDTILNHLALRNFWIKTVCWVGKEMINPYVKLLSTRMMKCYRISANAFLEYHQLEKQQINIVYITWIGYW